jgi:hypothetical protein
MRKYAIEGWVGNDKLGLGNEGVEMQKRPRIWCEGQMREAGDSKVKSRTWLV